MKLLAIYSFIYAVTKASSSDKLVKLNVLPNEIADNMRQCALKAAESTSNERMGTRGKAAAAKIESDYFCAEFTKQASDLISATISNDIKRMFWNAAWYTANTRKGYRNDAKTAKDAMNSRYQRRVSQTGIEINLKFFERN